MQICPFVQGVLFHQGSGLSLSAGSTTVQLTNFVIDPGDPARLFGDVPLNSQLAAMKARCSTWTAPRSSRSPWTPTVRRS